MSHYSELSALREMQNTILRASKRASPSTSLESLTPTCLENKNPAYNCVELPNTAGPSLPLAAPLTINEIGSGPSFQVDCSSSMSRYPFEVACLAVKANHLVQLLIESCKSEEVESFI